MWSMVCARASTSPVIARSEATWQSVPCAGTHLPRCTALPSGGPILFACPRRMGRKTTQRGGVWCLLPLTHAPSPLIPSRARACRCAVGQKCLHGVRIATAPSGPRNDRCGRWSAPGLRFPLSLRGAQRRGNLMAPIYGTLQPNDTSPRLPWPRWGLAMTAVYDGTP